MVNSVGRSRGCLNCKRRKRKCDEKQPKCTLCEQQGEVCEGIVSRHFIMVQPKAQPKNRVQKPQSKSASSSKQNSPTDKALAAAKAHKSIGRTLNASPTTPEHYLSFTLTILGKGNFIEDWYTKTATSIFLSSHAAIMLDCFKVLSMVMYGELEHVPGIRHQGMTLYGHALERLRAALLPADNPKSPSPELFVSVASLCHVELLSSPDQTWVEHAFGLERLFAACKELSYIDRVRVHILEQVRPVCIIAAIARRTPSLMASVDWRAGTDNLDHLEDKDLSFLLNLFAQLPQIYQEINKLSILTNACADLIQNGQQKLEERLQTIIDSMHRWRQDIKRRIPDAVSKAQPTLFMGAQTEYTWRSVFHFKNWSLAQILPFYSSLMLLLLDALNAVSAMGKAADPEATARRREEMLVEVRYICRSMEYLIYNFDPKESHFYVLFPLRVARRSTRQKGSIYGAYVDAIMGVMEQQTKFRLWTALLRKTWQQDMALYQRPS